MFVVKLLFFHINPLFFTEASCFMKGQNNFAYFCWRSFHTEKLTCGHVTFYFCFLFHVFLLHRNGYEFTKRASFIFCLLGNRNYKFFIKILQMRFNIKSKKIDVRNLYSWGVSRFLLKSRKLRVNIYSSSDRRKPSIYISWRHRPIFCWGSKILHAIFEIWRCTLLVIEFHIQTAFSINRNFDPAENDKKRKLTNV